MGQTPFPTNEPASAENAVVSAVVTAAENKADAAIEKALDTALPFFALPVVKQVSDAVISEIVSLIGKYISVGVQEVGTFVIIDTQVSGEKTGISQALAKLMLAEKSGDQNAIQSAVSEYQKAQSALVNSDGAAPPIP